MRTALSLRPGALRAALTYPAACSSGNVPLLSLLWGCGERGTERSQSPRVSASGLESHLCESKAARCPLHVAGETGRDSVSRRRCSRGGAWVGSAGAARPPQASGRACSCSDLYVMIQVSWRKRTEGVCVGGCPWSAGRLCHLLGRCHQAHCHGDDAHTAPPVPKWTRRKRVRGRRVLDPHFPWTGEPHGEARVTARVAFPQRHRSPLSAKCVSAAPDVPEPSQPSGHMGGPDRAAPASGARPWGSSPVLSIPPHR